MPTRWIKFVLLACIVCWATGAAQFVHERVQHADHDEPAKLLSSAVARPDNAPPKAPHRHHDDHDDCPTCQMLAHMSAMRVVPPTPISVHLPTFCIVPLTDWRSPIVKSHTFAPIRGPPMTGLTAS
jgi:hypothetical protein